MLGFSVELVYEKCILCHLFTELHHLHQLDIAMMLSRLPNQHRVASFIGARYDPIYVGFCVCLNAIKRDMSTSMLVLHILDMHCYALPILSISLLYCLMQTTLSMVFCPPLSYCRPVPGCLNFAHLYAMLWMAEYFTKVLCPPLCYVAGC